MLHRSLVAQELLLERLLDALAPSPAVEESLMPQLTALVKTFERPRILRRLVASMRRLYPALRIVVVDDSREPTSLAGVEMIATAASPRVATSGSSTSRHRTC